MLTLFNDLSGSMTPPINSIRYALQCCFLTLLEEPSGRWLNSRSSQVNLIWFPTNPSLLGIGFPKSLTHSVSQCLWQFPVTAFPSTGSPNSIETSWRVIVHSPTGRWKVCVSGLHLSTIAVINDGLILKDPTERTSAKPALSMYGLMESSGGGRLNAWWTSSASLLSSLVIWFSWFSNEAILEKSKLILMCLGFRNEEKRRWGWSVSCCVCVSEMKRREEEDELDVVVFGCLRTKRREGKEWIGWVSEKIRREEKGL